MGSKHDIDIVVTFKAPESLVKKLDANALAQDRSRSAEIRQMLLRALAADEKTA